MEDRNNDIVKLLSTIHIFDQLKEEQLLAIADQFDLTLFKENEVIFESGAEADGFYIIQSGRVSIRESMEEDALEYSIYQRGDYFGEEGFYVGQRRQVYAVADTNVIVLRLDTDRLDPLAQQYPEIIGPIQLSMDSYRLFLRHALKWRGPREAVQFMSRQHVLFLWLKILPPILAGMVVFILVIFVFFEPASQNILWEILLVLAGIVVLGWFAWNWIDWSNDYSIITNRRVVALEKVMLFYESRQEAPMDAVLSAETKTDLFGRWFGYGDVILRTFTGIVTFKHLAYPHLVVRLINEERGRATQKSQKSQRNSKEDIIRTRIGFEKREMDIFEEDKSFEKKDAPQQIQSSRLLHGLATFFRLRSEENEIITYRTHWFILLQKIWYPSLFIFILFVLLILAIFNVFTILPLGALVLFELLCFIALGAWWLYQYMDWRNDKYVVTQDVIIDVNKKPLGSEQKRTASLRNIQTVEFERLGLISLILNYGTVFIRVGDTTFTFDYVFNPSEVQREVFERYQEFNAKQKIKEKETLRNEMAEWIEIYHEVVQRGGTPPPPPSAGDISGYNIGESG
jgi:hypothetical protein